MEPLGTLVDRLQGLLSKGFLLAGFLPAVMFLGLNLALAYWIFPAAHDPLAALFHLASAAPVLYWTGGLLLSFIAGIAFWSLNPWFRQLLEGRYLPDRMRVYLVSLQNEELQDFQGDINKLFNDVFEFRKATQESRTWAEQLRAAAIRGEQAHPAALAVSGDLLNQHRQLQNLQSQWQPIPYGSMKKLFDDLLAALVTIPPSKLEALDDLHTDFLSLLDYALKRIESDYDRMWTERSLRFPADLSRLGPTRMANLAEVHREYGLRRYGLDVEVFWLRLLKIVRADANFYPILEEAKTQLDFSVATTVLLGLVTLVWLPLTLLFASSLYPYLIIAGFGPPLAVLFYKVVSQNYRTFFEAVRSAIDLHRFELLQALHLELPSDSVKERALWQRLMNWSSEDGAEAITYKHESQKASDENAEKPHETVLEKIKSLVGLK